MTRDRAALAARPENGESEGPAHGSEPRPASAAGRTPASGGAREASIGKSPVEPDRGCHAWLVSFRLTVDGRCSERPRLRLDHRWLSVVLGPRRSVGLAALTRRGCALDTRRAVRAETYPGPPAQGRLQRRAASSASARALTRQEPPTGRMPGRPVVPRARPRAHQRFRALQRPARSGRGRLGRGGRSAPVVVSVVVSADSAGSWPDRGAATRGVRAGEKAPRRMKKSVANARLAAILLCPTRTLRLRSRVASAAGCAPQCTTAALRSDSAAVRKSRWKRPFPTRGVRCGDCLCSVHFERRGRPSARIFGHPRPPRNRDGYRPL